MKVSYTQDSLQEPLKALLQKYHKMQTHLKTHFVGVGQESLTRIPQVAECHLALIASRSADIPDRVWYCPTTREPHEKGLVVSLHGQLLHFPSVNFSTPPDVEYAWAILRAFRIIVSQNDLAWLNSKVDQIFLSTSKHSRLSFRSDLVENFADGNVARKFQYGFADFKMPVERKNGVALVAPVLPKAHDSSQRHSQFNNAVVSQHSKRKAHIQEVAK